MPPSCGQWTRRRTNTSELRKCTSTRSTYQHHLCGTWTTTDHLEHAHECLNQTHPTCDVWINVFTDCGWLYVTQISTIHNLSHKIWSNQGTDKPPTERYRTARPSHCHDDMGHATLQNGWRINRRVSTIIYSGGCRHHRGGYPPYLGNPHKDYPSPLPVAGHDNLYQTLQLLPKEVHNIG